VPDLDFDRYPLAKRQQAVTRMMPETIALMDQVEAGNRDTPTISLLDQTLNAIAHEDAQGRSGTAYLDSWLARLIQDDPEHQAALWLRVRALERDRLSLSPQDLLTAIERLVRLTRTGPDTDRLQNVIDRCRRDPRYRGLQLPLTVQAAELAGRQKEWANEATLWHQVLDSTESGQQGTPKFKLLRHALTRLLTLYQQDGPLPDKRQTPEVGLRLARLPGGSLAAAQAAYSAAVHRWKWRKVQAELSTAQSAYPEAALLAWLDTAPGAEHKKVLHWLKTYPAVWAHWPLDALQALDKHLASDLDKAPELLLIMAETTQQGSKGAALSTQYLLRAWIAGTQLSLEQLKHVAAHLPSVDADWCKERLSTRKDAATLLTELCKTRRERNFPLAWLQHFPAQVIQELPTDVLDSVIEAGVASGMDLSTEVLASIAARANRPDGKALLATLARFAEQRPTLATQFLKGCLAGKHVDPAVVQALFPALLQAQTDRPSVVNVLDELSGQQTLLRGEGMAALCLDNWATLREDMAVWPLLRGRRIEGSTLVDITTRWLAYTDRPHRLDLMVIILQDVKNRSSATWLTPVSLRLQALCAAGRFLEAEEILSYYPEIRIKGRSARDCFSAARSRISEREGVYGSEFKQLWALISSIA